MRRINSIDIKPGKPLTIQNSERFTNNFEYWDIRINAKSFLYRQVRRIIGTLVAAAEDKLTEKDVYEMLTIPSKYSWRRIIVVPPHGLYLTHVEYPKEWKTLKIDESQKKLELESIC